MSEMPADAPKPRLCHIIKWPDFDGYGFNLHADKSRPGQYIGKVDENSPADVAGLKEGDRIIEVNGVNILNENHKQVVQRIKNIPNETKLLVVDSETDRWYKEKNFVVRGDQSNIAYGTSVKSPSPSEEPVEPPVVPVATNGDVKKIEDYDSRSINSAHSSQSERSSQPSLPPTCPSDPVQEEGEEIPDPVAEAKTSEISVSITDYDNVIFAQENERSDEIIPSDDKSESSDDLKEQDNVEAKIQALELSVQEDDDKDANDDTSIKSDKVDAAINVLEEDDDSIKSIRDEDSNQDKNSEKAEVSEVSSLDNERKDEVLETDSRSSSLEMESSTSTKCAEEPSLEIPIPGVEEPDKTTQHELTKSSISTTPSPPPPVETEVPISKPEVPISKPEVPISKPEVPISKPEAQADTSNKAKTSMKNGGLNLNMTVAEMRAQLAAKKKFDPRKDQIDLKKKYQIIQNM